MAVKVLIPTPLQSLTESQAEINCDVSSAKDVKELIEALDKSYPNIKKRLCDDEGKLRRFVNFYVNDEDIRFLDNEATTLKDGDVLSIVPAIAGG
ncbi:MAG: MoaD/ThiS family protein [Pseudanabaenaceae cyanobacterium]|jgi:molybdopterin synthase sulfur carrier subunit